MIDAIKATIDFRISALDTSVEPVDTLYEGVCAVPAAKSANWTVETYAPAVIPVVSPTLNVNDLVPVADLATELVAPALVILVSIGVLSLIAPIAPVLLDLFPFESRN